MNLKTPDLTRSSRTLAADSARVDAVVDGFGAPILPHAAVPKPRTKAKKASGLPELPAPAGEKRKARRRERRTH